MTRPTSRRRAAAAVVAAAVVLAARRTEERRVRTDKRDEIQEDVMGVMWASRMEGKRCDSEG